MKKEIDRKICMNIEQQVASLELSKKLKKLGVKQDSLYYWVDNFYAGIETSIVEAKNRKEGGGVSAFTVAELGEMLPITVHTTKFEQGYHWQSHYEVLKGDLSGKMEYVHFEAADTEADARAKMLIYLIEKKLIKLK